MAIEKHEKVLDSQRAALHRLSKPEGSANAPANEPDQQARQNGNDLNQIRYAVEEMISSVQDDLSISQSAVSSTLKSISTYASERLSSDDQILEAIAKLNFRDQTMTQRPDSKAVENWCHLLVSYRTSEVRSRIEAIYKSRLIEALNEGINENIYEDAISGKDALQSELNTLREEIASVSEIVVGHQLRQPVLAAMERSRRDSLQARKEWLDYVCLQSMWVCCC